MDKYNEALERAKKWEREHPHGYVIKDMMEYIFPELAESGDERIRKELVEKISNLACGCFISQEQKQKFIAYLEKQKEPHYTKRNALFDKCVAECDPEIMQRVSDEIDEMLEKEQSTDEDFDSLFDDYCDAHPDGLTLEECGKFFFSKGKLVATNDFSLALAERYCQGLRDGQEECWNPTEEDVTLFNKAITTNKSLTPDERAKLDIIRMKFKHRPVIKQKEQKPVYIDQEGYGDTVDVYSDGSISCKQKQKPNSTEEMPYITDEHFYEREPFDSFKYKLAEYMTKNCTKKEGPYGYEYGISAETILKMAEEELLKRGVVQKPAEWSEEDEDRIRQIERIAQQAGCTQKLQEEIHDWLKSLRPSWKPSEEQMEALEYVIRDYREDSCNATANYLQEILDHLKNM